MEVLSKPGIVGDFFCFFELKGERSVSDTWLT